MPLNRADNVPNNSLQTPYTTIDGYVTPLGGTVNTILSGPVSTRPSTGAIGLLFYNTTINELQTFTIDGWVSVATAPYAPTGVVAANVAVPYGGTPAASVRFTPSTVGSPGATYTVTSSPGNITATGSSSPITVSGLTAGTSYTFTVTASNSYGSAISSASAALSAGTISNAPTIGTASTLGSVASVAFTAPSPNTGAATITNYTAYAYQNGIYTGITGTGTSSPISVYGLTIQTPYTFTVSATNNAGISAQSSQSNSVTPSNLPQVSTSGGTVFSDATYYYQAFPTVGSSATLTVGINNLTADILVIAGGGAGGAGHAGGGGGAGGIAYASSYTLTPGTYGVTVGAGGVPDRTATPSATGGNGGNSQFGTSIIATGGGGGSGESTTIQLASSGGSGGGGDGAPQPISPYWMNGGAATQGSGTGYVGSGNAGAHGNGNGGTLVGTSNNPYASGGGGGGAGAAGTLPSSNPTGYTGVNYTLGGAGGAGLSTWSSWGAATGYGQNVSGTYYFGGGGGGGGWNVSNTYALGGNGGGGTGACNGPTTNAPNYPTQATQQASLLNQGNDGTPNTGGGGGGSPGTASLVSGSTTTYYYRWGGYGGSGLVIVRYTKASVGG